jgi:hypothetical protein
MATQAQILALLPPAGTAIPVTTRAQPIATNAQLTSILNRWGVKAQAHFGVNAAWTGPQRGHFLLAALAALAHEGTAEAMTGSDIMLPQPTAAPYGAGPLPLSTLILSIKEEPVDHHGEKLTLRQFARTFGREVAERALNADISWRWGTANGRDCPKSLRWLAFDFNDLALELVGERQRNLMQLLRDDAVLNPNALDDARLHEDRRLAPALTATMTARAQHAMAARTNAS